MEVMSGYKHSELGVIPESWNVRHIASLCAPNGIVRGPFGGALKKEIFVTSGFKVYEQKNAIYKSHEIGAYFVDQSKYNELKRFNVSPGDFIVSCSGTIGRIYQVPLDAPEGVINQALLKLTTDDSVVHSLYFYLLFQWEKFQARIVDSTQGGAMKNLVGMSVFKTTPVLLPPVPEQHAIAAALSDVDSLLTGLDRLIAKKHDIKQAALQQLLTGQTRLPGFQGEWEVKQLGDVATFHKGRGLPKSALTPYGAEPCIHYGELFTHYPEDIETICSRTDDSAGAFRSAANDVLMPTSDVTPRGLAKASCVQLDGVILGGDILVIRCDSKLLFGAFLSYTIRHQEAQILQLVTGTTVFHLYGRDMAKLVLSLPSVEEQIAIVRVLTDMASELTALEARRDKTRALKQGMMQELLTGKTRLVKSEAAHV